MPLLLDDFVMKHIKEPVHCGNLQFKVFKELLIRTLANYYKLLNKLLIRTLAYYYKLLREL